ncbi:MAG TPA: Wzz/FepE/Etk N-terminal domain-containing protein [bacterium]|nr:Wzz/FepE/Etk N-terminal domain-containing protein [bacterium]
MEFHEFITLIRKKRKVILGIISLFVLIGVAVVAVQKFKYSSSSQLLVVQENQGSLDAYTASKSTEHLSSVLVSVIRSNSFYTKVMSSSPGINSAYFGTNSRDQIKEWGKTVSARSVNDTGIIAISVFHPDRSEAEKIAGAVNYVLMTQHGAYDGAGDAVKVRLIDQPVTSSFPVKPNIPVTFGLALMLGFMTGLIYVYIFPENYSQQKQHSLDFENIIQSHIPNFNASLQNQAGYQQRTPSPIPQTQYSRDPISPYGNRATVSMNYQKEYIPEEEVNDPNLILRQGNMHNIID